MSRTHKRYALGIHRSTRGRLGSLKEWARVRTRETRRDEPRLRYLPPDPYDDIPYDKHCWIPYNAARAMFNNGWDRNFVMHKLMIRFKLTWEGAEDATHFYEYMDRLGTA